MSKYIYFVSVVDALFNNVLESNISVSDVLKHGGFGIGTLDSVEGEMVIYENSVYTATGEGDLHCVEGSSKTPMAIVTNFIPSISIEAKNVSFKKLLEIIDDKIINKNLLYAVKIEGVLSEIVLRCHDKQSRPFDEFKVILNKSKIFKKNNIKGVLVGFKLPHYIKNVNLVGYHFHFVDEKRKIGGHVYDGLFDKANVEISVHHSFFVELNNHEDFANVDFERKIDVEKLLESDF